MKTTLEEQRALWPHAIHEDAIWEGPMFETPVGVYPTKDADTVIVETHGGGPTIHVGQYTQRYFSLVSNRDGKVFRMREYCNPLPDLQGIRPGALGTGHGRDHGPLQQAMARFAGARPDHAAAESMTRATRSRHGTQPGSAPE